MNLPDLSNTTKQICKQNYKDNCHNCPLRPVCCKSFTLTMDNHIKWVNDMNELAESIK